MSRFSQKAFLTFITVGLICSIAGPQRACAQDGSDAARVHFTWAFGALVGPEGNRRLIAVDRDLPLQTGDRIKFMLAHRTPCFIYLFHLSGSNVLTLIYPQKFAPTPVSSDAVTYVPGDNLWFALDDETGTEKFYLLASPEPLEKIENLYKRLFDQEDKAARQATVAAIIDTIRELRRRHLRNTGPVERPIRLGGSFRGMDEEEAGRASDLSAIAVEIKAPNFYSRTFTIDHR